MKDAADCWARRGWTWVWVILNRTAEPPLRVPCRLSWRQWNARLRGKRKSFWVPILVPDVRVLVGTQR